MTFHDSREALLRELFGSAIDDSLRVETDYSFFVI